MAGFQVANFDFGQNIEKNAIERQRIAASSALQARGQDIQAAESEARLAEQAAAREEGARQFDEQRAERAANRDEDARQFDERMALAERHRQDERSDKERQNSWDDALKQQQMQIEDAKFQKWSAEIDELLAKGQRDREEYERKVQAQADIRESALGMVSEGVLLSGPMGGFTPSQVQMFNEKFGQQFDSIGRRSSITGEEYEDGLIHLVQYQKDKNGNIVFGYQDANGNVVEDPGRQNRNSQPLLLQDQTISKEDYQIGLGRLREYGGRVMKSGSGDGVEIAKINAESREKVAGMNNKTKMSIAELGAELKKMGYAVDEKKLSEAIRHNQAQEGLRGKSIEERSRHNAITEDQAQQRLDETAEHNDASEDLGRQKLEHNKNRLENDKAQKEADRQLRRELSEARRAANSGKTSAAPSRVKEINDELNALEKVQRSGSSEARQQARERVGILMDELRGNKEPIKSDDNTSVETADQEPPDGKYFLEKDGKSYHWGKSKSGKWGYFPDK